MGVDQILLGFHSRFATEAATKVSIRPSDDVLIQFPVNLFAIGKVFSFSEVRGGFPWFSLLDWSGRILYLFLLWCFLSDKFLLNKIGSVRRLLNHNTTLLSSSIRLFLSESI